MGKSNLYIVKIVRDMQIRIVIRDDLVRRVDEFNKFQICDVSINNILQMDVGQFIMCYEQNVEKILRTYLLN